MSRRYVLVTLAVAVLMSGALALVVWLRSDSRGTADAETAVENAGAAAGAAPADDSIPVTSEELIAQALAAGDISYEESLRARAYALFDDPRLEPAFRSAVVDWDAGAALFAEIDRTESTLSADLLEDLLPFRVRPNDPRSIFNRPRADVVRVRQAPLESEWVSEHVAGTDIRIWFKGGTSEDLKRFEPMVRMVWNAYPPIFPYPIRDDGRPDPQPRTDGTINVNPDPLIDAYMINGNTVDPRIWEHCATTPGDARCKLGGRDGMAPNASPNQNRKSSGYLVINIVNGDEEVLDTIAHELAHVTQKKFDNEEEWLNESTAAWVAYRVMKDLGKEPAWEYEKLWKWKKKKAEAFFNALDRPLDDIISKYGSWLFFFYASMEMGDAVVTRVWEQAAQPGSDDKNASNKVVPFRFHFPRFAVRNWNHDYLPVQYRHRDRDFPEPLEPEARQMPPGLGTFELDRDVARLAAQYYRFAWSDPKVRRVTLQNFYKDVPDAHVWAIRRIGASDWKEPEDWSRDPVKTLCRDEPTENVTELVLVVSNSHLTLPVSRIAPAVPKPRMLVEDVGCAFVEGSAKSTLRLKDERQDVTYASTTARLRFRPRSVQDMPGNVQYDLMPTSVTWTVSGTQDGCTLSGSTVVTIHTFIDQPLDPTRPAYGYLNVVGVDGGDFHSVQVSAVNPAAMLTKSCPDGVVTHEPFRAVWLLNVLSQTNTHTGTAVEFKGTRTLAPDRFQHSLPQVARDFLQGTALPVPPQQGALAPGVPGDAVTLPPDIDPAEIEAAMARARKALKELDLKAGRVVYTFTWDLRGTP
jgi:hypothetical protein